MKCGTNNFFEVVGAGGDGATPAEARAAAMAKANQLLQKPLRAINRFYNEACPPKCGNATIHRPQVYTLDIYTTYDATTNTYNSLVAYVVWGQVDCN